MKKNNSKVSDALNLKNISFKIFNQIERESSFDYYSIKGCLQLLTEKKPLYVQFKYIGTGKHSLVLKVNDQFVVKIKKINRHNEKEIRDLDILVQAVRSLGKENYIHQVDDSYFLQSEFQESKIDLFYVQEMEFANGNFEDLFLQLRNKSIDLKDWQKERMAIQLFDALNIFHQCGSCHRNIKPSNILYFYENGNFTVKLADLQVNSTEDFSSEFNQITNPVSSYKYIDVYQPLEAYINQYYKKSDLFRLGLVLVQLDTPSFQFTNISFEKYLEFQANFSQNIFPISENIKKDTFLYKIIQRCLHKNPSQRQQSQYYLQSLIERQKSLNKNQDLIIFSIQPTSEEDEEIKLFNILMQQFGQDAQSLASKIIQLKKYACFNSLGAGSQGIVIEALNRESTRIVALKIQLIEDQYSKEQIETEVQVVQSLQSQYIVKIYEVEMIKIGKKEFYIIQMEKCDCSLYQYLRANQAQFSIDETMKIQIAYQIIAGLNILHSKKIIHRDIKPQNILVCTQGSKNVQIKIADFGFVKEVNKQTQQASYKGTPMYSAPEFSKNLITMKSDIFSLGIILLEIDNYENFSYSFQNFLQLMIPFTVPLESINQIRRNSFLYQIASQCLKYSEKQRPQLNALIQQFQKEQYNQIPQLIERTWDVNWDQLFSKYLEFKDLCELIKCKLESQKENYQQNSTLEINFSNLNLEDVHIKIFSEMITHFSLAQKIVWSFSGNFIEDAGLQSLSQALKKFPHLLDLELWFLCNKITDNGLQIFCDSLKSMTNIQQLCLNFQENKISDKGILSIPACLKSHQNLINLNLHFGWNYVQDEEQVIQIFDNQFKNKIKYYQLDI
ncbi:hypothetical protein ABPG74_017015 [Tetrahymena malaccensis]